MNLTHDAHVTAHDTISSQPYARAEPSFVTSGICVSQLAASSRRSGTPRLEEL